MSNKSTSEVFLIPFWYVNVESKIGKPISLAIWEPMTKLWMPSTTHEPIECFSKVLDGTLVACGLRIGRGFDVMFKVSFSTTIMSLVLSFKCWKLINKCIHKFLCHFMHLKLALHKLMYMCLWDMKIWCPSTCGVVVSSPLANKVRFSFVLRGLKDCGMTIQAFLTLIIGLEPYVSPLVWITYLMAETLNATLTFCVAK